MAEKYKVTFNIDTKYGYVELDEVAGCIEVVYPDAEMAGKIKKWLEELHEINTPDDDGPLDKFSVKKYQAPKSRKDFQTVLTRIWQHLGVHVDWSFPPEKI